MAADPFQVLGVSPDASEDEIRQAYRRLAKKYHPDLNPGDKTAAQKMNEVNAAYDAIKNPQAYRQQQAQQQQQYRQYQQYQQQYRPDGQSGQSYDDPFAAFWQQWQQQTRQDPGASQSYQWYTYDPYEQEDDRQPGSSYHWTYHRTRRRGSFLVRLLGIYLLIQLIAAIFGSCGYRGAYYDPYYYRYYNSYSDTGESGQSADSGASGSWY